MNHDQLAVKGIARALASKEFKASLSGPDLSEGVRHTGSVTVTVDYALKPTPVSEGRNTAAITKIKAAIFEALTVNDAHTRSAVLSATGCTLPTVDGEHASVTLARLLKSEPERFPGYAPREPYTKLTGEGEVVEIAYSHRQAFGVNVETGKPAARE